MPAASQLGSIEDVEMTVHRDFSSSPDAAMHGMPSACFQLPVLKALPLPLPPASPSREPQSVSVEPSAEFSPSPESVPRHLDQPSFRLVGPFLGSPPTAARHSPRQLPSDKGLVGHALAPVDVFSPSPEPAVQNAGAAFSRVAAPIDLPSPFSSDDDEPQPTSFLLGGFPNTVKPPGSLDANIDLQLRQLPQHVVPSDEASQLSAAPAAGSTAHNTSNAGTLLTVEAAASREAAYKVTWLAAYLAVSGNGPLDTRITKDSYNLHTELAHSRSKGWQRPINTFRECQRTAQRALKDLNRLGEIRSDVFDSLRVVKEELPEGLRDGLLF